MLWWPSRWVASKHHLPGDNSGGKNRPADADTSDHYPIQPLFKPLPSLACDVPLAEHSRSTTCNRTMPRFSGIPPHPSSKRPVPIPRSRWWPGRGRTSRRRFSAQFSPSSRKPDCTTAGSGPSRLQRGRIFPERLGYRSAALLLRTAFSSLPPPARVKCVTAPPASFENVM